MHSTQRVKGNIAVDVVLTVLVLVVTGLRFVQQRKLRPLPRSYILGNITLGLSNLLIVCWASLATFGRARLLGWLKTPVGRIEEYVEIASGSTFYVLGGYLYFVTLWLIKISFLTTYFRIVPKSTRARQALYLAVGIIAGTFVTNIVLHSVYSAPVSMRCTSLMAASNTASNVCLLVIPLMILRELRLSKRYCSLGFVYLVGSASIVASLVGFLSVRKPAGTIQDAEGMVALNEGIKVWISVEFCTASIAFCLPSLRNLLRSKRGIAATPEPDTGSKEEAGAAEEDGEAVRRGDYAV